MRRWTMAWLCVLLAWIAPGAAVRPAESPAEEPPVPSVADLPLIEVPSQGTPGDRLAVLYSGDGGWTALDKQVSGVLSEKGIGVVGVSSLRYFWKSKPPDIAAGDLARILAHYSAEWKRHRIVLIGYSRGADVLPFMVTRLAPEIRSRVDLVALLGPGLKATFELHMADFLVSAADGDPILPEVKKFPELRRLCVYGKDEDESLCRSLEQDATTTVLELDGAHHFGGAYPEIGQAILKELGLASQVSGQAQPERRAPRS